MNLSIYPLVFLSMLTLILAIKLLIKKQYTSATLVTSIAMLFTAFVLNIYWQRKSEVHFELVSIAVYISLFYLGYYFIFKAIKRDTEK